MTRLFLLFAFVATSLQPVQAQNSSQELIQFEKQIEKAVVGADAAFLKKAYAEDFRFKHGTGAVDSKTSWMEGVVKNKGQYVSRETDSVEVELHDTIAITQGKLTVHRTNRWYIVYYVRIYRKLESGWELFMHRTYREVHQ